MGVSRVKTGAVAGACLGLLSLGAARAEGDVQVWAPVTVAAPAGEGVTLNLEVQTRFTEDVSRVGQFVLRPSLERRFNPRLNGSLGYAYVRSEASGAQVTQEHRLWQQASYTLAGAADRARLAGRTRLEQRRREGLDGTGVRLRQQLRLEAPLRDGVRAVGWTEGHYNLNGTTWAREGVEQWRTFLGVSAPLGERVRVEPGYLNQVVFRPGEDRVNHVLSISTAVRF